MFRSWFYGLTALAFIVVASFGWSFANNYMKMSAEIARLEHAISLREARELSHLRMIERRNDAIAASKCKQQIEHWVRNPDEIPRPLTLPDASDSTNLGPGG